MKDGQIVESGSHEHLISNGTEYIRLNQIEKEKKKSEEKSEAYVET